MSIADRDRKLLWARAGGACALCKRRLTADARGADRDVVLGEEAHIVSEEPNGPRFRPMARKEVDSYGNLLLLCPEHHKIVDEQVTSYTEHRLQILKREHEQWVTDRISATVPAIKFRDAEPGKPLTLQRIDTGKELMHVVVHTYAVAHDNPEPRSSEEAELVGGFFQNTIDYSEVWDDIGPSARIQAEFSMSEEIRRLRDEGLVVYAGIKMRVLEGGIGGPTPWPVAYVVIYRSDDETIRAESTGK